jgi:hypothetical protein
MWFLAFSGSKLWGRFHGTSARTCCRRSFTTTTGFLGRCPDWHRLRHLASRRLRGYNGGSAHGIRASVRPTIRTSTTSCALIGFNCYPVPHLLQYILTTMPMQRRKNWRNSVMRCCKTALFDPARQRSLPRCCWSRNWMGHGDFALTTRS